MNSLLRDLLIGTIGSVIGALIVFLSTSGFQFTRKAKQRAAERKEAERKRWQEGDSLIRQEITNEYLFGILKYMLVGNLLWALPSVVSGMTFAFSMEFIAYLNIMYGLGSALGAIYFYRGLGLVIRYMNLKQEEYRIKETKPRSIVKKKRNLDQL